MVVIINDIIYLPWSLLESAGYSVNYLRKATSEYRQGTSTFYENIEVTEELRNSHNIPKNVRSVKNLIALRSLPSDPTKNLPTEAQLREQHAIQTIEWTMECFYQIQSPYALLSTRSKNHFTSNPKTALIADELTEQFKWLYWLASVKPSKAQSLCSGSKDDLIWRVINILKEKDWSTWKIGKTTRKQAPTREGIMQVFRRTLKPFIALHKTQLKGLSIDGHFETTANSLIHGNHGNQNGEKLSTEQRATIFQIYSDGNAKPNEIQTHIMYLGIAKNKIQAGEWDKKSLIGLTTLKNFLNEPPIRAAWFPIRHGKKAAHEEYTMVTKRIRASFANALWIIDGTPFHLYYMEGDNAYARLNVFVVLDAHSWAILGFYVSDSENHEQVTGALRSACMLSKFVPWQIQSDNGSAVSGYYGRTCIQALANYYTPATPGNARSKAVEAFFKHFNNSVARFYPGFTHSPVMGTKLDSKPNPEALQAQLKGGDIPSSRAEAIRMLHEMFAVWNHKPFNGPKSPLEKYRESIQSTAERQREYTQSIEVAAFFTMPGALKRIKGTNKDGDITTIQKFIPQDYEYTTNGITLQVGKERFNFTTDSPEFNDLNLYRKFAIRYDAKQSPLKTIFLYQIKEDGVVPVHFNGSHMQLGTSQFSQALADRTEGEGKRLTDHLQAKKLQQKKSSDRAESLIQTTKMIGTFTPVVPGNVFPKEIMTQAKQQIAEQIINGDDFTLASELPAPKQIDEDRFAMVEAVKEPTHPAPPVVHPTVHDRWSDDEQ